MFSKLIFIFCVFIANIKSDPLNIGLLVENTNPNIEKIFNKAIEIVNAENSENDGITFNGITANVAFGNTLEVSKKLCKMFKSSIVATFGPLSKKTAKHAMSICDAKEMPFMDPRLDFSAQLPTINLYPHPSQIAAALRDTVLAFGWKDFGILYEAGEYLELVNELLQLYGPNGPTIVVRRFELELNGNYRNVLRGMKKLEIKRIVVVGSIETLPELLKQAQQVGILTESYQYIIGNLDLQTIDLEPFQHSDVNIISLRSISPENSRISDIMPIFAEEPPQEEPQGEAQAESQDESQALSGPFPITVPMALIYDGILLLAETFKHDLFEPVKLNCNDENTWDKGFTLVNYIKSVSVKGLTGDIKFDHQGLRTDVEMEVIELTTSGISKIGDWKSNGGLTITKKSSGAIDIDNRSLMNKTFVVMIALSAPYGMLKESAVKLTGNDQYEGFGIELIDELSKKLGYKYIFRLQEDNAYGSLNPETGEWNGMIREILDNRADLAITDLTMTSERESAVDFTIPFMNLGISILHRKPIKEPPKLFSFMSPFSGDVWLSLGIGYISVSLSLLILGRMSPVEWDNPYPCIEEPTELENQFSFSNCLWFTMGALLQQGSEIAAKAPSTRTIASTWWFFTLIMVSSYTANLAAFLTIESLSPTIENAEDLAARKGGVQYGAKKGGSTLNFFKDAQYPTYQKMYEYMIAHPELLPSTNDAGVNKVENENYAFLMESTTIEYIVERKCNLRQVGGLLDEKGYGIAMRKNWPYRDALSQALLELQEQGILTKMKTKWWKEKRGGGACSDTGGDSGALPLELANLGGVFLVLIIGSVFAIFVNFFEMLADVNSRAKENKQDKGQDSAEGLGMPNLGGVYFVLFVGCIIATSIGIVEWLYFIYKLSIDRKTSFKYELIKELKFVIKCSGNVKTVEKTKHSSDGSSSRRSSFSMDSLSIDNIPGGDEAKLCVSNSEKDLKYQK